MAKRKKTQQRVSQAKALNEKLMYQEIERGVGLISAQEADKIIRTQTDEYVILLAALRSQMGLTFAVMNKLGLPNIPVTQHRFSQHQLLCAQLIHNAYALGIKEGQERMSESNNEEDSE